VWLLSDKVLLFARVCKLAHLLCDSKKVFISYGFKEGVFSSLVWPKRGSLSFVGLKGDDHPLCD